MQIKSATLLFILTAICLLTFGQPGKDTSKPNETTTSIQQPFPKTGRDSVVISIQQLDEITKFFKTDESWWKDILPSVVALLVVLISTIGAVYIGKEQIKTQTTAGEDQIRSQEAQSQEQLRVAREQIQETSKMTLAQVRANNISQARINWIQDLRGVLSEFVGEIAIINTNVNQMTASNAQTIKDKLLENINTVKELSFKVKLFLNSNPKETNHVRLEKLIDEYMSLAASSAANEKFSRLGYEILETSRKILKEAWEQAKNEGTK